MIILSAQSAKKSTSFCLSCDGQSCLAMSFSLSQDALHSVSSWIRLCANSLKSALEALVIAPISEYKSLVSGRVSITIWHKWCRSECLWTVSFTSGTFARYSIWNPFTGWPFKTIPIDRSVDKIHLNVRFDLRRSIPCFKSLRGSAISLWKLKFLLNGWINFYDK